jgi:hypothetical protein
MSSTTEWPIGHADVDWTTFTDAELAAEIANVSSLLGAAVLSWCTTALKLGHGSPQGVLDYYDRSRADLDTLGPLVADIFDWSRINRQPSEDLLGVLANWESLTAEIAQRAARSRRLHSVPAVTRP